MKSKILSTDQVRGILDGRVTAFRVPIKPQPEGAHTVMGYDDGVWSLMCGHIENGMCIDWEVDIKEPCKPGDILYVRETWRDRWGMAYANYGTGSAYPIDDVREIEYGAGGNGFFMRGCNLCPDKPTVKWGAWSKRRSPATMPREAARLFLRVTGTRVERVQEILCGDMKREGCIPEKVTGGQWQQRQRDYYIPLWNARHAKRGFGWDANPWTVAVAFEVAELAKEDAE